MSTYSEHKLFGLEAQEKYEISMATLNLSLH